MGGGSLRRSARRRSLHCGGRARCRGRVGRCLDVMRLSRITADSPAVEATSVRCQAVLEGDARSVRHGRSLLDSARTTGRRSVCVTACSRPSCTGDHRAVRRRPGGGQAPPARSVRRVGSPRRRRRCRAGCRPFRPGHCCSKGGSTRPRNSPTTAMRSRARSLQTAIAARSVLAEVLTVRGDTDEALRLADEAVRIAAGTDITLDHASALASLARVRLVAGDAGGARRAADLARELYEAKGAVVSARSRSRCRSRRRVGCRCVRRHHDRCRPRSARTGQGIDP